MPIDNKYEAAGLEYNIDPSINVKNLVNQFVDGRFIYSGRYVKAEVNYINETNNTFTIYDAKLDDKHVVIFSKDFEIYINGVKVSSDIYTLAQVGQNVVFTFKENELNYDEFCADDVAIFGKFAAINIDKPTIYLLSEENNYIITEDEKLLII